MPRRLNAHDEVLVVAGALQIHRREAADLAAALTDQKALAAYVEKVFLNKKPEPPPPQAPTTQLKPIRSS